MKTPIYFRDLMKYEQADFIRSWNSLGMTKLIEAVKNNKDVMVGEYCDIKKCKVMQ